MYKLVTRSIICYIIVQQILFSNRWSCKATSNVHINATLSTCSVAQKRTNERIKLHFPQNKLKKKAKQVKDDIGVDCIIFQRKELFKGLRKELMLK